VISYGGGFYKLKNQNSNVKTTIQRLKLGVNKGKKVIMVIVISDQYSIFVVQYSCLAGRQAIFIF